MDLNQVARSIFQEALADCSVEQAFLSKVTQGSSPFGFVVRGGSGEPDFSADLSAVRRVLVIAAGKGAATMLRGLLQAVRFPPQAELSGILISPESTDPLPHGIRYFAGGHPLPNAESFAGAGAALSMLKGAVVDGRHGTTFCFFLISGGASAMMELPLDPSVSLADTVALYEVLVHSGATIAEINIVRKHFSAVKGGRLGELAAGLQHVTLLVSDVPASEADSLASGPTLPDRSTRQDCLSVLERHALLDKLPTSVLRLFEDPLWPETPKPGAFAAPFVTLLSAADLAEAARTRAQALGFHAVVDHACDEWDYRDAAAHLLIRLRALRREHKRVCLIAGGEVTVKVAPPSGTALDPSPASTAGIGGRNQHFVLYAATLLTPQDGDTVILSAGSDGIDGNSEFAGAVLGYQDLRNLPAGHSHRSAGSLTLALNALSRFDSSTCLNGLGATIRIGPTGNNLRDLKLLIATDSAVPGQAAD